MTVFLAGCQIFHGRYSTPTLKSCVNGDCMNETENQSVVASEASNPGVREDILHYDPLLD